MWKTFFVVFLFAFLTGHAQSHEELRLANEYYSQGEIQKAKSIFDDLAKKKENILVIHNNYFFLLLENGFYEEAEKYISRVIRHFPTNINYQLDEGYIYSYTGDHEKASKIYNKIINDIKGNTFQSRIAAEYFVNRQLYQNAVAILKMARDKLGSPHAYALELANIYRLMNENDLMVQEYLSYVSTNPSNLTYVKNTLQNLLTTPEELQSLEQLLYNKIQEDPESQIYSELLIWVNLQQKNFYGAFIQARAMDKRFNLQGTRSIEIGRIALENDNYENAIKIFSYVIEEYPATNNYMLARMYLIKTYEKRVRNTYPIEKDEIRRLISDYQIFIREAGINRSTLEALRNKAILHAFYLDEMDSAVLILNKVINNPRTSKEMVALSKLDLGDIYLLMDQPWESTLLYSQVEKANDDSPIGYEAKLKNAKLSYYKGDFLLAQEHLDILKEATTREISNDAIALSLLIKDNIAFDSSEAAMKAYSQIELLIFQNNVEEAKKAIDSLYNSLGHHSLIDELLWMQVDISKKQGDYKTALEKIELILNNYGEDILADDAFFEKAEIYERHLNQKEVAMQFYKEFLIKFPGSVYVAEARKRYRQLRGDFDPETKVN